MLSNKALDFTPYLALLLLDVSSPHFKSCHMTSLVSTFLTFFLKICDQREKVTSTNAGSWFQSFMVLFTNEYFTVDKHFKFLFGQDAFDSRLDFHPSFHKHYTMRHWGLSCHFENDITLILRCYFSL
jgi:hypothetical protein